MADAAIAATVPRGARGAGGRASRMLVPRLITGLVHPADLGIRRCALLAPAYVAKPTTRADGDPARASSIRCSCAPPATRWRRWPRGSPIALVFGTVIGLLMGRSPALERAIRHYVNGFYAMPMIVVLPLFSLWFGYSASTRIATIIFAAIFSIIVNVADGARSVPREYLEVARSFRSSRLRMMLDIVLPASMPYLLAGFRLAAGRALIGAVVAEFFLSVGGLGYYILYNSRTYHHNEAFVGVLLLAAFGVGFELLVQAGARAASCPGTGATRKPTDPRQGICHADRSAQSRPRSRIGARASSPTAWC